MSTAFTLTVDGAPDLVVRSFRIIERAHFESRAEVEVHLAVGEESNIVPADLLGAKATLEIAAADTLRDDPRRFHGVVDEVDVSVGKATFVVVPRLSPLGEGRDHKIFLDQDSVAIAKSVLEAAGLDLDVRVKTTPPVRRQCVQVFESPLEFVLRILAEDGVSLWVEHDADKDVIVFGDDPSGCHDLPGGKELPFRAGSELSAEQGISSLRLRAKLTHDGSAVGDYNPEKPALDQNVEVGGTKYARYTFPGHYPDPDAGKTRAQILLEEAQSERLAVVATTNCRHVAVGFVFQVADAPRAELAGPFRILEVRHEGHDHVGSESGHRYSAELVAVPQPVVVRPKRRRPASFGGLSTMTVTGASGDEIHTDDQARIKAHFRWDRERPFDDTASTWIRPLQPALSGGFLLPRTGWEVLVGFRSEPAADGDTPYELGRMINGQAPPAEALPGQKVRSNWGTLSTPGGGKQNQLRFDDAAGNEGMLLNASKDFNERTENDKVTAVTANETNTVSGNHLNTVAIQQGTAVDGAQSYSIGGNRDLTTVGVLGISAASETVSVGANRNFKVGGDYETKAASIARIVGVAENVLAIQETNRHVTGASSIAVGATWAEIGGLTASQGVLGASTLTVAGPLSVRASNISINATTLTEKYAGAYAGTANGKFTAKSAAVNLKASAVKVKGADVFFKATGKIVVKAGGVTITITPGSIKVKGKIKGDSTSVVSTKEEVR
ncbi:MAG: type VI secretion system tip protein TssI/VgrG [Polyangiaceae bacterium]